MSEESKVHVGNLPYSVREYDLEDLFSKYGRIIEVKIIKDHKTERPMGYAFVTFDHIDDARDAIDALDCTEFRGRRIKVEKSRPRRSYDDRSYGGGRYGGGSRYDRNGGSQNRYRDRDSGRGSYRRDDNYGRDSDRGGGRDRDRDFGRDRDRGYGRDRDYNDRY